MELREGEESEEGLEREGRETPGGGSEARRLSSFCIRRLSLAAMAMAVDGLEFRR